MTEPLAVIRSQDDLIEALRAAKAMRGLSNEFCDERGGIAKGHTDKALGPSRAKSLSPMLFDLFMSMFAVKLVMVPDFDAEAGMRAKWEGRDTSNVRTQHRVSQMLLERAKPHVLVQLSKAANAARSSKLPEKLKSEIAKKASEARWKKQGRKRTKRAKYQRAWYRKSIAERLSDRKLAKQEQHEQF